MKQEWKPLFRDSQKAFENALKTVLLRTDKRSELYVGKMNRETWLLQASGLIEVHFAQAGYTVPKTKVSVGFPGGGNRRRIGEYWTPLASDDRVGSVFISPTLGDGLFVLGVLVHELVHATVGIEAGHGPKFRKCALKVGLEGKMKSTVSGPQLTTKLNEVIALIGPYPHAKLNPSDGPTKKQKTRMIKQRCDECDYTARSSQKCIDEHGPVICPGCHQTMKVG